MFINVWTIWNGVYLFKLFGLNSTVCEWQCDIFGLSVATSTCKTQSHHSRNVLYLRCAFFALSFLCCSICQLLFLCKQIISFFLLLLSENLSNLRQLLI